jgi:hypothetical protein
MCEHSGAFGFGGIQNENGRIGSLPSPSLQVKTSTGVQSRIGAGLLGQGLVDDVTLAVDRILAVENSYWPEAIAQASQSLSFEGPKAPPGYRKKVQALHDKLIPSPLEERLRLYVCELPRGYFEPGTTVARPECDGQRRWRRNAHRIGRNSRY